MGVNNAVSAFLIPMIQIDFNSQKRRLGLLIVLLSGSTGVFAQVLTPVKWSYAAKKTSNTEAVVFLKATIEDGWHIYSTKQKDGGPVKTSFTFKPLDGYVLQGKVSEPEPVTKYEPSFVMDVHYFEHSVVFQQKIKLKQAQAVVKGQLEFMVCNDQKCLPPEDVDFRIAVK